MADSLADECTPLKHKYDSCFNAWFEGYLEPVVGANVSTKEKKAIAKQKAEEYEAKCGKIWADYRDCVQKAVQLKGLTKLLDQARHEDPLLKPSDAEGPSSR